MRAFWAFTVAVQAAWMVLRLHRVRSTLTLAVCSLGAAGVVIAGLLGKANVAEVQQRLRYLGGGLLVVSPNVHPPYPGRLRQLDHFISLDPEDGAALAARLPALQGVIPVVVRNSTVRQQQSAVRVRLVGTEPDYARLRNFTVASGRFLAAADDGQRVIVLGHAVSREASPGGVRVGELVMLGGQPYAVVGILQPLGLNFAGEDEDHQAFIPLNTYRRQIANRPWVSHLYLQLRPEAKPAEVIKQVNTFFRQRHGRWRDQLDDVIIRDFAEIAATQTSLLTTVTWAVTATSGLLLLLGVVGIATLLLLVVRQRRPEIGLRRALGATPLDIAVQFFIEGILLAGFGVGLGLVAGSGVAAALTRFMAVAVVLDPPLILLAAGLSLGSAGLACLLPALAAARLEPAAALRT